MDKNLTKKFACMPTTTKGHTHYISHLIASLSHHFLQQIATQFGLTLFTEEM